MVSANITILGHEVSIDKIMDMCNLGEANLSSLVINING